MMNNYTIVSLDGLLKAFSDEEKASVLNIYTKQKQGLTSNKRLNPVFFISTRKRFSLCFRYFRYRFAILRYCF